VLGLHRSDALGPQPCHLAVGQRPVQGAKTQPVGQAPRALAHCGPPVDIEQLHGLAQLCLLYTSTVSPADDTTGLQPECAVRRTSGYLERRLGPLFVRCQHELARVVDRGCEKAI